MEHKRTCFMHSRGLIVCLIENMAGGADTVAVGHNVTELAHVFCRVSPARAHRACLA